MTAFDDFQARVPLNPLFQLDPFQEACLEAL
jgi:hypothetical protein